VVGDDGELKQFITVGMSKDEINKLPPTSWAGVDKGIDGF